MLKHVCFLLGWSGYEALPHFTQKLIEAMERRNIRATVIDASKKPLEPSMFSFFNYDRPDLTCSFNIFDPLPNGKYVWDILKIPHWAILIDPAYYSIRLAKSPYTIFSTVDRNDFKILKKEEHKVFFWPHAIEKDISFDEKRDRSYGVVFFGSCYDYEALREYWIENLPE